MTYSARTIMPSPKVGFRIRVCLGAIDLALGIFGRFGSVSEDPPVDYTELEIGRGASIFFSVLPQYSGSPEGIKTFGTPVILAQVFKTKHSHYFVMYTFGSEITCK